MLLWVFETIIHEEDYVSLFIYLFIYLFDVLLAFIFFFQIAFSFEFKRYLFLCGTLQFNKYKSRALLLYFVVVFFGIVPKVILTTI